MEELLTYRKTHCHHIALEIDLLNLSCNAIGCLFVCLFPVSSEMENPHELI